MFFGIWQKPSYYCSKFFNFFVQIVSTKEAAEYLAKMQSFHLENDDGPAMSEPRRPRRLMVSERVGAG